ncbi:MAG: PadR family transcriptional regulator [Thermoanaerobaculia bacterium]
MSKESGDLIPGTLDMLVLKALQLEPMHGWGIAERIEQWSKNVLSVNQGSLYPSLYRLQRQGWIDSEWQVTGNGRRARYYKITRAGKKQLAEEQRNWQRLSEAVNGILEMTVP